MTCSLWTPHYDVELARREMPSVQLNTRYGQLRLLIAGAARTLATGWVTINNARHHLNATLGPGADGRWWIVCGDELDPTPDLVVRSYAVQMRRDDMRLRSSDSARSKAAVELERAVNAWADDPASAAALAYGERWKQAFTMAALHRELAEAVGEGARARRRASGLRERMYALAGDSACTEPSRISLAEAVRHYRDYLNRELHSLYELVGDGEPISAETLLKALLALERLIRLEHTTPTRDDDMRRWDTVQALLEAPYA